MLANSQNPTHYTLMIFLSSTPKLYLCFCIFILSGMVSYLIIYMDAWFKEGRWHVAKRLIAVEVESLEGVRTAVKHLCFCRAGPGIARSLFCSVRKPFLTCQLVFGSWRYNRAHEREREKKQKGIGGHHMLIRIFRNW